MIYFFSNNDNGTGPISFEEHSKYVQLGKLSRDKDRVQRHGNNNKNIAEKFMNRQHKLNPRFGLQNINSEKDTRVLSDFDWKSYVKASGLKPGEDKNQRNAYNQEASDKLDWDRAIPDVRSAK